jgi:hypothetical protein
MFDWSEGNSFCGGKDIHGFTEGLAAMAEAIFLGIRGFGVGFAYFREEKHGIVTEAVCAARRGDDRAFGGIGNDGEGSAVFGDHDYAHEMGSARISCQVFHFAEEFGDAVGIRSIGAGIAG